ncbi:hypothetical protein [Gloeomargarita lithophora]|uniref:hypothetical protein n=1 Tax=Gloeomargarita lithophora TaxID=1188228 RepID=UPI0008F8E296|nr:hypothetical protein [Gloeomargarita lithophora]
MEFEMELLPIPECPWEPLKLWERQAMEQLDEEYELWCHHQDLIQEQLLAHWGVESLEDIPYDQ